MALKVKGQGENRKITVRGDKKPILIYCHGDSVTAGAGSYVNNLKVNIEATAPLNATVVNAATSGQNMSYLLPNLHNQVLQFNPDVVTLCVLLNELGDVNVGDKITTYVNQVLAHVNPNGKSPLLILLTDNYCGQNIGSAYVRTTAQQDATHNRLMTAYSNYASNSNVAICDNYVSFKALGEDTQALFDVLDVVHVHPNEVGNKMIIKNMQAAILAIGTKFYNG